MKPRQVSYFLNTMRRQKTSARIATPSSRKSARFVAPTIDPAALG